MISIRRFQSIVAALAILATSSITVAQYDAAQDVVELEAFSVSASRIARPLGEIGASITLLDAETLARFEAEMMSETLRHVPGLYLRNTGNIGNNAGVSMRGLPIVPLVLIDGIEMNDAASGFVFNMGNLPTVGMERAEVLRGAQGALYGGNALTGVISIVSSSPLDEGMLIKTGVGYGSHDTMSSYLSTSGGGEGFSYSATANYYTTNGYSSQPESFGPEWADNDAHTVSSIRLRVNIELTDSIDWNAVFYYRDSQAEYDPGLPSPWSTPVFENYGSQDQLATRTEWIFRARDGLQFSASATYQELDTDNVDAFPFRSESEHVKFDLISSLVATDGYDIVVGAEYEMAADGIGNHEFNTTSLFTEHVVDLGSAATATVGARFDENSAFGSETTWKASAVYDLPVEGLSARASYGTGFDAPEINSLFGQFGNPDLKAETGSSFDLGLDWVSMEGDLEFGLTYFDVEIEDRAEFLRSTFSFANVDWVSSGIEAYVAYDVTEDTRFELSWTYADTERKKVEDPLILQSPETMYSLIVDQEFLEDKLLLRVSGRYVDDQEDFNGAVDSFVRIDASASYEVLKEMTVWVRVDNVFDKEYSEVFGYSGTPFSLFGGVRFEF
jgi:vitamin B12 transporter